MPSFTMNIPDNLFNDVKEAILIQAPIPSDGENNIAINPETGNPWTENQWVKKVVTQILIKFVKAGLRKKRIDEGNQVFLNEQSTFDGSIIIS